MRTLWSESFLIRLVSGYRITSIAAMALPRLHDCVLLSLVGLVTELISAEANPLFLPSLVVLLA